MKVNNYIFTPLSQFLINYDMEQDDFRKYLAEIKLPVKRRFGTIDAYTGAVFESYIKFCFQKFAQTTGIKLKPAALTTGLIRTENEQVNYVVTKRGNVVFINYRFTTPKGEVVERALGGEADGIYEFYGHDDDILIPIVLEAGGSVTLRSRIRKIRWVSKIYNSQAYMCGIKCGKYPGLCSPAEYYKRIVIPKKPVLAEIVEEFYQNDLTPIQPT